ncbi:MAG: hypothetical protein HQL94_07575 [Magnetococcales bacterium]|nr:hypothetical protein [Magnetococcales bacterium]
METSKRLPKKMSMPEIMDRISKSGFLIKEIRRLPTNYGDQICLESGQFINVFDRGTYYVQGRQPQLVEAVLVDQ